LSGLKARLLALGEDASLSEALVRLRAGRRVVLAGLVPGAKALYLLHLHRALAQPLVLVTSDEARAVALLHHLRALASVLDPEAGPRILGFPDLGANPYDGVAPHFQATSDRVAALLALRRKERAIVVAPAAALLYPLPHPDDFDRMPFRLQVHDPAEPAALAGRLTALGYERVDLVEQVGEFALRGGVLDVFTPLDDQPRRVEFFGDEVESVRWFDHETQRGEETVAELLVAPVQEFGWGPQAAEALARRIEGRSGSRHRVAELAEMLRSRGRFPGMEACAGLVSKARYDLGDHATDAVWAVDEPFLTRTALDAVAASFSAAYESSDGLFPPPEELLVPVAPILARLDAARLAVADLAAEEEAEEVIAAGSAAVRNYRGRFNDLADDLRRVVAAGGRALLVVRGAGRADRVREILTGLDLAPADADDLDSAATGAAPGLYLGHAPLEGGFELRGARLLLLTEHEIFGDEVRHRPTRRARLAAFTSDFRDLRPGDLVVHVDHGIGRFEGLQKVGGNGAATEMMILAYKDSDRLFVPLDRLDLVQKYSGVKGANPVLDRLGGTAWQKTRGKARKAVQDMTAELLELYARRKTARGHAFAADTEWQRELEDAFEYRETPDQIRAIEEVKADMEVERPMDRLLVGDVGFGKTEVALRAVFKAVMEGKQAAVLAPTTVLALQHLRTFRQRFAAFPVKVEMLSRFVSPKGQKVTLARLAGGDVDVLIGTHRLLSKDVRFHDLGLLVVDEEQRFGVAHKERLKKLRMNVDVLSMSATPIPRTLQMSLAGVRDMSVIETAPENRLAIQTSLVPFRESIISQAIRQEMRRGGQIYFVHNRVESIYSMANLIRRLVPECRVAVGHGQMGEADLERTMFGFLEGDADLLVSTTIIENGLDLPRVNTLIVNRADRFGLSQLYQLRGRIGRSDVKAYAYLMIPPGGVHHPVARRRLAALQEFSDLGSGFRIAALDLELRGAGNLLGSQQHGHIAAIGFEMYCQMLERAVREIAGEEVTEEARTSVNLGVDIRLPESFIAESNQRLVFYKRIASAEDLEGLTRIRGEMEDRFGRLPDQGDALFHLAELRLVAARLGVRSVDYTDGALQVKFAPESSVDPDALIALLAGRDEATLTSAGVLKLPHLGAPAARLEAALDLLKGLR